MKLCMFLLVVLLACLWPWQACFCAVVFVLFALLGAALICKSQEGDPHL